MATQLRYGVKFGKLVRKSFYGLGDEKKTKSVYKIIDTISYRKNEVGISDSIFLYPLMHGERTLTLTLAVSHPEKERKKNHNVHYVYLEFLNSLRTSVY